MAKKFIDPCALRRNAKKISHTAKLIAVIKDDAYGHGMTECARILSCVANMFAVANESEARSLLDSGIKKDILILHPCASPRLNADNVIYTLSSPRGCAAFEGSRTALKLNTGMNRFGADDDARVLISFGQKLTRVHSVYTHLRCPADKGITDVQYARFERATKGVGLPRHIAASGALCREAGAPHDYVRCGIAIYGGTEGYELDPFIFQFVNCFPVDSTIDKWADDISSFCEQCSMTVKLRSEILYIITKILVDFIKVIPVIRFCIKKNYFHLVSPY